MEPAGDVSLPLRYEGNDYDARFLGELVERDDMLVLSLIGRVTQSVDDDYADAVHAVLGQIPGKRVLIDFTDCQQLASAAVGYLVRLFREATQQGKQVVAVCPDDSLRSLMKVLGVGDFLLFFQDEAGAKAFFAAQGI